MAHSKEQQRIWWQQNPDKAKAANAQNRARRKARADVRTCLGCGNSFMTSVASRSQFCGRDCYVSHKWPLRDCDECGAPMPRRLSKQPERRFCSKDCSDAALRENRSNRARQRNSLLAPPFAVEPDGVGPRTCFVLMDDGTICGRPHTTRGFCHGHYSRNKKNLPLGVPFRRRNPHKIGAHERDEAGRKKCRRCLAWLPLEHFGGNPSTADKLAGHCKRCVADSRHNLSVSARDELISRQNGLCICRGELIIHGDGTYTVDHDHSCCSGGTSCGKCVRGLLCQSCNWILGHSGDNARRLLTLAIYLDRRV